MKRQVFVIHGGTTFDSYEEYLEALKSKEVDLERMRLKGWKAALEEALGEGYEVISPRMPSSDNAKYSEWKIWFEKFIPFLSDGVVFVGHSLGGVFLAKYLSEEKVSKKISGTFLVAAPFDDQGEGGEYLGSFVPRGEWPRLLGQAGKVFLYHSSDDPVVPFSNLIDFKKALSGAVVREFSDRGHFNQEEFPEIAEDIKSLG